MNMGLDFSEILVIMVLILIFFGSKEIPSMVRQAGRLIGQIRMYTEKVRKEINEITKIDEPMPSYDQEIIKKKEAIRQTYIARRKELGEEQRAAKSAAIWENLKKDPAFAKAKSVLAYVEIGAEVAMRPAILEMLGAGKRVIVPYSHEDSSMGVGEITSLEKDIIFRQGIGVYEPAPEKRNNFFKTDIQFVICPAVAFDIYGARLGRGKGSYDRFCKELKGVVPVYGIAFDCQIMGPDERLPFAYHDVVMDQVITESGALIKKPEEPAPQIMPPMQPAG
jgi:5-formyltetrahydrofolate cyclo-ligase